MSISWNKDNIASLLTDIKFLEDTASKKNDITYGKTLIPKQQEYVLRLLKDRGIEERVINDLVSMIRNEEASLGHASNTSLAMIIKVRDSELNFEAIFKKEIKLIKDDLSKLNRNYELQKTLNSDKYAKCIQIERQQIIDIKQKLGNILNSKEEIQKYISELSKIGELARYTVDYEYMGLKVPANIILASPISKYDLEPFLAAYKNYREALRGVHIKLVYRDMGAAFMQSQYEVNFLFHKPQDRMYILKISNTKESIDGVIMNRLTFDEKKGWFGHELNHILQYSHMSNGQLLGFTLAYGFGFLISHIPIMNKLSVGNSYVRKTEARADAGAIDKGVGPELVRGRYHFITESNAPGTNKKNFLKVYTDSDSLMDQTSKKYYDKLNKPLNEKIHSK